MSLVLRRSKQFHFPRLALSPIILVGSLSLFLLVILSFRVSLALQHISIIKNNKATTNRLLPDLSLQKQYKCVKLELPPTLIDQFRAIRFPYVCSEPGLLKGGEWPLLALILLLLSLTRTYTHTNLSQVSEGIIGHLGIDVKRDKHSALPDWKCAGCCWYEGTCDEAS